MEKPTLFEICTEFNPGLMMIDDEILLKAVTKSLSGLGQMDTTDSSKLLQAHTHTLEVRSCSHRVAATVRRVASRLQAFKQSGQIRRAPVYTCQGREAWREPVAAPTPVPGE